MNQMANQGRNIRAPSVADAIASTAASNVQCLANAATGSAHVLTSPAVPQIASSAIAPAASIAQPLSIATADALRDRHSILSGPSTSPAIADSQPMTTGGEVADAEMDDA